jgi:tetratricopeptide (TPR) repeat protein
MTWLSKVLSKPDRKQQATDEYNLGLASKYRGEWEESLARNRRAAELNPQDEATWWNLGIAATAVRDWPEARRAWAACGITLVDGIGEISMPECWGCVRLNPEGSAEVVWGKRIDPARTRVMNVPLPASDRRYGDIILNDGAPEGTRTSNGREYPVFNELALWKRSSYTTYEVEANAVSEDAKASLGRLCDEFEVAFEDWGTIRNLCAACSRGNPAQHDCTAHNGESQTTRLGFASRGQSAVNDLLRRWLEMEAKLEVGDVRLVVSGASA